MTTDLVCVLMNTDFGLCSYEHKLWLVLSITLIISRVRGNTKRSLFVKTRLMFCIIVNIIGRASKEHDL